jgi:hypothetical protein
MAYKKYELLCQPFEGCFRLGMDSAFSRHIMEGIEKSHTDKYKELMNDWNYDASCMPTSLLVQT